MTEHFFPQHPVITANLFTSLLFFQPNRELNQSKWRRWLLLGGSLLGLVGILCCGLSLFGGFQRFQDLQAESDAIQPTLRAFLDAGERGDTAAALACFADDATAQVTAADLERLFQARPEIFAASAEVTITTINVTRSTAGTVATVAGTISYASGAPQRRYTATLRKQGEQWRLVSIQFPEGVGS